MRLSGIHSQIRGSVNFQGHLSVRVSNLRMIFALDTSACFIETVLLPWPWAVETYPAQKHWR